MQINKLTNTNQENFADTIVTATNLNAIVKLGDLATNVLNTNGDALNVPMSVINIKNLNASENVNIKGDAGIKGNAGIQGNAFINGSVTVNNNVPLILGSGENKYSFVSDANVLSIFSIKNTSTPTPLLTIDNMGNLNVKGTIWSQGQRL